MSDLKLDEDVKLPELQGPTESIMQALQRNHSELLAALGESAADKQRIAELEKELGDARAGNVAWESAVGGLEAHLEDRIAMNDPAEPKTYLQILQADVADVRRDTEAIRKATWHRESMCLQRAERAESELAIARERHEQEERWIPKEEGLPTVRALTYTPHPDVTVQYRIVPEGLSRTLTDATHWRPLPAPPESMRKEKQDGNK